MARRGHSPAIDSMIDGWDGGDQWGSAMSMAWAVAEVAAAYGEREPERVLEVTWGAGAPPSRLELETATADPNYDGDLSFETRALAEGVGRGDVTMDDLRFAGRALNRYLDLCKAAGLDY